MTRVQVHLADAPTDLLVHLVGLPVTEWRDVAELVDAVAPEDTVDAAVTVVSALRLLIDLGYAARKRNQLGRSKFCATTAGRAAVAEAVASDA